MSEIQRWGPQEIVKGRDWVPAEMMVYSEGEWVKFTDHERVVAEKDARVERAEGTVEYFRKQVGDLKHEVVKQDARIKELEAEQADLLDHSQNILFDAGRKAERERIKARIEQEINARYIEPTIADADDEIFNDALGTAISVIRATVAAIDKEGEGEVNTTEEEGDRG